MSHPLDKPVHVVPALAVGLDLFAGRDPREFIKPPEPTAPTPPPAPQLRQGRLYNHPDPQQPGKYLPVRRLQPKKNKKERLKERRERDQKQAE